MCAIAGILHFSAIPDGSERVGRMADSMAHRGPDGRGVWTSVDVALGFRRLAIVDIAGGNQPMVSGDGRVVVVFNGEIYNHRELRIELEAAGHRFRSDHSDTEVLVHGWRQWGTDLCRRLNGMFAFAIWDHGERSLFLARDRFGIKPLYLARAPNGALLLASEVKGIIASGLVTTEPDVSAVVEYLSFMNLWGGRTPFRGISMLDPGTWRLETPAGSRSVRFWSLSTPRRRRDSLPDLAAEARAILGDVMRRQADTDVPIAAYLSGGIDSTAVSLLLERERPGAKCYSCIFDLDAVGSDAHVDEREDSRLIAAACGLQRVEHMIDQEALTETIDHTVAALEYPRMGMAYVNDLIAGRVARDVKVVLSGLGGDELTGGYVGRYAIVPRGASLARSLQTGIRRLTGRPDAGAATRRDPLAIYRQALNVPIAWAQMQAALTPDIRRAAGDFDADLTIRHAIAEVASEDDWDTVMHVDTKTYLHGLLVMEDKLSMSHGLETRVPLLDNQWIDFLADLPWSRLTDGQTGKIVFRDAMRPWVPPRIHAKPKMGFAPPDASWYRGRLQGYVAAKLSPARIARRGIFNPEFVEQRLAEHFAGTHNHVALIWCLLSLESWSAQTGFFGGKL